MTFIVEIGNDIRITCYKPTKQIKSKTIFKKEKKLNKLKFT
jgi:hypothetical protein